MSCACACACAWRVTCAGCCSRIPTLHQDVRIVDFPLVARRSPLAARPDPRSGSSQSACVSQSRSSRLARPACRSRRARVQKRQKRKQGGSVLQPTLAQNGKSPHLPCARAKSRAALSVYPVRSNPHTVSIPLFLANHLSPAGSSEQPGRTTPGGQDTARQDVRPVR